MFHRSCLFFVFGALSLSAATWKPVDPQDLKDRTAKVEPGADAEALFWEVQVSDEVNRGTHEVSFYNYLRIKIYNNRGRDRYSTINIPFGARTHLDEIDARTIHADGTIIGLSKDAIHESTTVRNGVTTRQKTFPMPSAEPGSIIEYQWKVTNDYGIRYLRIDFQRDIPIRFVRYQVKPWQINMGTTAPMGSGLGADGQAAMNQMLAARRVPVMAIQSFNCNPSPLAKHGEFYETTMENVPAFHEEQPYMPPADRFRYWSLAYYRSPDPITVDKYWESYNRSQYTFFSEHTKPGKQVRSVAQEITSGADTPLKKLALLSDFCRTKIRNLNTDEVSAEERAAAQKKTVDTPDDTLRLGVGSPMNVLYLFAALASAAGFEARIAELPDRRRMGFDRSFADPYFLTDRAVAVMVDGKWHFYSPAGTYIQHDLLAWHHEGVLALITDPKEPHFEMTPFSAAEQSTRQNQGVFKLSEDGTLEGDILIMYTGHEGSVQKENSERQSPAQREETFTKMIQARLSAAEISNIQIENATDIEKPFTYRCHLRIAGYAQATGKRLFFAPDVFQQGLQPVFELKERKYPVLFPYAKTDTDTVTIDLPDGYELEAPQIPAPIQIGSSGQYTVEAAVNGNRLIFRRRYVIGKEGHLGFAADTYPALKRIYDSIALSDAQTLTLKQKGSPKGQ
jgi:Domain of Unknown Function with PDB structure (DUF3857)/Transglutaminase-like superfamily